MCSAEVLRTWPSTERNRGFRPGESPHSAIELRDQAAVAVDLSRQRCCGKPLFESAPEAPDRVLFAGASLSTYRAVCASCGRTHRRYFRLG